MKIKISNSLNHINDRRDLLQDFIVFVSKDLQCMPCDVDIVDGRGNSGLTTTAQYDPNNHHITVNGKNRQFGDVLRSVAHEMVHHKQNVNGELGETVQDVGGDIEDEANARAGELLKSFAYQAGPERIYESHDLIKELALPSADDLKADALIAMLKKAGKTAAELRNLSIDKLKELYREIPELTADEIRKSYVTSQSSDKIIVQDNLIPGSPDDDYGNSTLKPPVDALRVTSNYGWRKRADGSDQNHLGIDINGPNPGYGFAVDAAGEGVVYAVIKMTDGWWVSVNYKLAGKKYRIEYGHLGKVVVKPRQIVQYPTTLGSVGARATTTVVPHVHVEVYVPKNSNATDAVFSMSNKEGWELIDPTDVFKSLKPKPKVKSKPAKAPETAEVPASSTSNPNPKTGPMQTMEESKSKKESVLESYIRSVILESANTNNEGNDSAQTDKKKLDTPTKSRITKSKAIDKNSRRLSSLDPVFRAKIWRIMRKLKDNGYPDLKIMTAYRSPKEQEKMVAQGHSKVPVSKHNALTLSGNEVIPSSKALDLIWNSTEKGWYGTNPENIKYFQLLGYYVNKDKDLRWGGNFKKSNAELAKHKIGWDPTHIELNDVTTMDVAELNAALIDSTLPTPSSDDVRSVGDFESVANIAESIDAIRAIVRESLTTYGVGHTDPTNGGPGQAFRLGVDYKNASTNIPHVGTGYVDRTHSLPYEVRLRTNQDAKQIYDTVFADGINTAAMNLTPDQVSYNPDGLKLQCHIATGRDAADERDVKLISQEIYKSMMGSPGKAKDAIFDIEVEPVNTKIRR